MRTIPFVRWIANAAARLAGPHGAVSREARDASCCRLGPELARIVPSDRRRVTANGASQQRGGVHEQRSEPAAWCESGDRGGDGTPERPRLAWRRFATCRWRFVGTLLPYSRANCRCAFAVARSSAVEQ